MTSSLQDFSSSILLDAGLIRQSVAAGEAVPAAEVISLAAAIEAIYISASLESREFGRIDQCQTLWTSVAQLFNDLAQAWVQVESNDPQVKWLRNRIRHYHELALDRAELYCVSERDRIAFSSCRESEMRVEPSAVPQAFTPREVARIDVALSRRLSAAGNR